VGGDDVAVEFWRRVEIVVISGEAGVLQPLCLRFVEHAECAADFHIERRDGAHHIKHAIEIVAVRNLAPRGPHAEACRAFLFRVVGRFANGGRTHQLFARDARPVVRAL